VNEPTASPIVGIYEALRALDASWSVEIGRPEGDGWIAGKELTNARSGPLHELLVRIGERSKTNDRRTIAALFALRYGWASAMAIAPHLLYQCVPDVSLGNVSFKFKPSTFFERTAMHRPRGTVTAADGRAGHESISTVPDDQALLRELRHALSSQAAPVVEALFEWSGFARRGTWGMLTSSWAAQFTALCKDRNDQRPMLPVIEALFAGNDDVARMQPRLHAVAYGDAVHLYQRRASCCRWYLLPQGELCASCPLVSHDERMQRNLAWMKKQQERSVPTGGHG
jgi:ferric iron reductase protein FhuF